MFVMYKYVQYIFSTFPIYLKIYFTKSVKPNLSKFLWLHTKRKLTMQLF